MRDPGRIRTVSEKVPPRDIGCEPRVKPRSERPKIENEDDDEDDWEVPKWRQAHTNDDEDEEDYIEMCNR